MLAPDAHPSLPAALIACHECDLLQTEPVLAPGETARCARCGAFLARNPPDSVDRSLALSLAAAILYLIANIYPLVGLEMQGQRVEVTLAGALLILWRDGMQPVAALVGVTTLVFPLLELAMILVVLVPLRLGRVSPRLAPFFRLVRAVKPWGMVEVFLLGMLVSLVKLSHLADVILGAAFWAMAALIVVLTLAGRAFDSRLLWQTPVIENRPRAASGPLSLGRPARPDCSTATSAGSSRRRRPAAVSCAARAAGRRCTCASPPASPPPGRW